MPPIFVAAIGAAIHHRREFQALQQKKREKKSQHIRQQNTLEENAVLEIILNQTAYFPGETVEGIVTFYLKKDLTNNKQAKLLLHIKGMMQYQESEIESRSFDKNSAYPDTSVHQHIFYNHRFLLAEEDRKFERGVYVIPFTFKLHDKLPRTIKIVENDINFQCFYKIVAFWQIDEENKLKFLVELPILQKPPLLVMNSLTSKFSSDYRKEFCCFGKSSKTLTLELFASTNILKSNEEFQGFCKVKMDNISLKTLFFKKLEIKIIRLLRIQFKGIEKKLIQTDVLKKIIFITSKNTTQINPDTLKIEFKFQNIGIFSASTENKYMKLAYVMSAKPSGLNMFEKERNALVNNQGYLFFSSLSDQVMLAKIEEDKKNEKNAMETNELLGKSCLPEMEKKKSTKLEKLELVANLEENLREILEKEEGLEGEDN